MTVDGIGAEGGLRNWGAAFRAFTAPPVVRMLFLGFSAGLPFMLVFSTLSIWLTEAGISRSTVTMLSWAALAYSFKFVWAPLVDRMNLPGLTRLLGRRRAWLLVSQIALIAAMIATGFSDPTTALTWTALGAVAIAFSSATQDIVIDAYRIEAAETDLQSMMSAMYIAGYRIGLLSSGAGALWLAAWLEPGDIYSGWTWTVVYGTMAGLMGIGIVTTFLIPEPALNTEREARRKANPSRLSDHWRLLGLVLMGAGTFFGSFYLLGDPGIWLSSLSITGLDLSDPGPLGRALLEGLRLVVSAAVALAGMSLLMAVGIVSKAHVASTYFEPVLDFFRRYGRLALLILLLIGTYRIADIVMGTIANVFYTEMAFTKEQIATYTKVWGLGATLLGGFFGGVIALRQGVMKAMFIGAILVAATNLLFALLAHHPGDTVYLFIAITGDNLAGGLASAAFVAYLSALTSVQFTAMQYALFSSLMTLFPKILAGYSGSVVTALGSEDVASFLGRSTSPLAQTVLDVGNTSALGYELFFIGCALIGVPVVFLVMIAAKYAPPHPSP